MAGNGYFDKGSSQYQPSSEETWDDFDASSSGNDWDSLSTWQGTPVLPLTFTADVIDYGSTATLNYTLSIDSNYPATTTLSYGDSVDSAGDIVTPSSLTITPSSTSLSAVRARYFQFSVSVDRDSANLETPYIGSINTSISGDTVTRSITDIDTSTLSGSTGVRQLSNLPGISTVTTCMVQPHITVSTYVADSYVAADYVETSTDSQTPLVYIDKSTTPLTLYIYDADTYGKRTSMDCTVDVLANGLRALSSDALGNITETV